jgi:hypothetical protein
MLKEGKGLKNLIASNGQWNTLQAILYQSNIPLRATPEAAWWTNTITLLPDNSATSASNLSTSGTIYYINSDRTTTGYYITADKIGIVSLNNSKLNIVSTAPENCSNYGDVGTDFQATTCSNSRKFTWLEFDDSNPSFYVTSYNDMFSTILNVSSISYVWIYTSRKILMKSSSFYRIYGGAAWGSVFENLTSSDGGLTFIDMGTSAQDNIFSRIKGGNEGLTLGDSSMSTSPSRAMAIEAENVNWYWSKRATINNMKSPFLALQGPERMTVSNLYSNFTFSSLSTLTKLTGLWLVPTGHTCLNTGGENGFTAGCALGGSSNATKLTGIDPGLLTNITGDGTTQNQPFVAGSTCPSAAHGNKVAVNQETSAKTYLLNAYEIIGDELGNENLLCESNESCIYMPNIGSNQGSGDFYSNGTCSFQNGTVTVVSLYAYPNP